MSEFTAEKVVQAYEQLQTCNDTNLKAEADVYLNSFMESAEAWRISRELIVGTTNSGLKFVGATVLYKKIKEDFRSIKPDQKQEILNFVTQSILGLMNEFQGNKLAISTLCSIYGYFGIAQIKNREDATVIKEMLFRISIISNQQDAFIMLLLQQSLLDELEKINIEMNIRRTIIQALGENIPEFEAFWIKMLNENIHVEKTLECILIWSKNKIQLGECVRLTDALLTYLSNPSSPHFIAVSRIFTSIFEKCIYGNTTETINLKSLTREMVKQSTALQCALANGDLSELEPEVKIYYLLQRVVSISSQILQPILEKSLNEVESEFCTHFLMLFMAMYSNFTIIAFDTESQSGRTLMQLAVLFLSHTDKPISWYSLQTWDILYRIISKYGKDMNEGQKMFFIEAFFEALKRLFEQTKVRSFEDLQRMASLRKEGYRDIIDLDDDDDNDPAETGKMRAGVDEGGVLKHVTLRHYRAEAEDIFFRIYKIMTDFLPNEQGATMFFGFFYQCIDQSNPIYCNESLSIDERKSLYFLNLECVLDAMKSIKDEFSYQNDSDGTHREFIGKIFNILLDFRDLGQVYIVSRIIQFFEDYSPFFKHNQDLSIRSIDFIFSYFHEESLTDDISEVFSSITLEMRSKIEIDIYAKVAKFINEKLPNLTKKTTIDNLVSGLSKLAKMYEEYGTVEEFNQARVWWLELIQQRLDMLINQNIDLRHNKKVLELYLITLNTALDQLDSSENNFERNHKLLLQLLTVNFARVIELFKQYHSLKNIMHHFVLVIRNIIRSTPIELFNFGDVLLNTVIKVLQQHPYKYSSLLSILNKTLALNVKNAFTVEFFSRNMDDLGKFFLQCLNGDWTKYEFICDFLELWSGFMSSFSIVVMQSQYCFPIFDRLIAIYKDYNESDSRKHFLKLVSLCVSLDKFYEHQSARRLLPSITEAILICLPSPISQSYNHLISKFLNLLITRTTQGKLSAYSITPDLVYRWIHKGLLNLVTEKFTSTKVEIVANGMVLASSPMEIKQIVHFLIYYLIGYESDDFIVQLEAKNKLRSLKQVGQS